ncbi:MAG: phenylalanine--tRNA ligase subunit beta [Alphaproteobacteria bacterium]|nr:phenylalanine--tRNA ligase subunit beta [Alphaproteobacteria bacterium]
MKFTIGWLKDHLDTKASTEEICKSLTAIGLEVESVEDRAAIYAPFKVAHVVEAEKHPNADRLRVCKVDTGAEVLQVVCGAPNARAGMKAIFAPSGSYIPGLDVTLKKSKIRDVESNGMLVSGAEMQLSEDSDGILDLPADTPIGTPMADLYGLNDILIEINLTPNRPDCAGIRGIARDLAAAGLGTLKPLARAGKVAGKFKSPISVTTSDTEACPLFMGRYIKNVTNKQSPEWLQQKLKSIGQKPISALVDVTNYLSIDLCRPLHVFDADKLKGDINVRLSRGGEKLMALNDKEYTLGEGVIAVCDDSGVVGLGGVMGGLDTGCTEETKNVYLECAYFDAFRIARAGRTLQINSDARYRNERGIDPAFTVEAVEIATNLIMELCGGEASEVVKAGDVPAAPASQTLRTTRVKSLTGMDVPEAKQIEILKTLGFTPTKKGDVYDVAVPPWRPDIMGEADLVEEIARIHGYDNLPVLSVTRDTPVTQEKPTANFKAVRHARQALTTRGLSECVTWSFMEDKRAAHFIEDGQIPPAMVLSNPISEQLNAMRPSIVPNLLEAAQRNWDKGLGSSALFETGPVFGVSHKNFQQTWTATLLRFGFTAPKHWEEGFAKETPAGLFDVKADVFAVLESMGLNGEKAQLSREVPSYYHPGRAGALKLGQNVIAYFGELNPAILEELKIEHAAVAAEIFLENIPEVKAKGTAKPLLQLPEFQPLSRDFAFLLDAATSANDLVRAVKDADKALITNARVFDVYTGKGIPEGRKSVAVEVTLQPTQKTLTEEDLKAVSEKISGNVAAKLGGALRG